MRQFQVTVGAWLERCFGPTIAHDRAERTHRFTEEALELAQATGCSKSEVLQLVDYVYGREVGAVSQEVGGVMVTLAALCYARRFSLAEAAYTELHRIHEPSVMERIRLKQAAKPKVGPLPAETQADKEDAAFEAWVERNCPSGDVTQVQDQWEASAEYLELQPEPRAPGWIGCGECDVAFPCHNGKQYCLRLHEPPTPWMLNLHNLTKKPTMTNTPEQHSRLIEAYRRERTNTQVTQAPIQTKAMRLASSDTPGEVRYALVDVTLDYSTAGLKVDVARAHLDESIPNRQKRRTELAFKSLAEGVEELRTWLRGSGYDV